ncbi:NAD(P)/FAD-dependent oxidoreductase [Streptomyces sporangiiformans]|uniref:NAD(P)/FAD-dependent oxidoreductase n=1 Tax=Streptomyces sporangiiformans TaxID=2315329 RepID=A0A505DMC6_9ACTN|nr:NAD(P)/FAD-dependent oxidoreductase [Streptomyces sporangiiformans]TPQ21419.1 NAD(P)/FAD-dependent oxidoreductase [Streptomyces sporangiiformans]
MIDLLVAGGGPAGLATAIHAARAGMEAVVIEPRPGPVDKACGEGVMPGGVRSLRALGVDPAGRALRGIRYVDGPHRAQADFREGTGLGVRRTVLHTALARRAAELGVRVLPGKVGDVRQAPDAVTAAGLTARWLVAADGLHSPVRRALGLDLRDRRPRRYGLRRHYRVPPWSDFVEVHWSRCGEAYVTPVADDLVGVAVLSTARCAYASHLDRFPDLASRLRGGTPVNLVRGAGPLRQRVRGRVAGRVLLVGDAAGYIDALTGEGIALALASAEVAVRCLRAGRAQDYERAWRRLSRRHRLMTEALVRVSCRPRASGLVVPAASWMPPVFAAAVQALQ